jgi:hypothetical protein
MVRRLTTWALAAFLLYLLLTNPDGAVGLTDRVVGVLRRAGDELATFVDRL